MLSPNVLERATAAYRKGYYDGHAGKPSGFVDNPEAANPFAISDYNEGYKAGANDAHWAKALSRKEG